MSSLRVLLVESDAAECERIAEMLETANHDVLSLNGIGEAADALELQRFDAVLVPPDAKEHELNALSAQLLRMEMGPRSAGHVPILAREKGGAVSCRKSAIEEYLPGVFEVEPFADAVRRLAKRAAAAVAEPAATPSGTEGMVVFDTTEFAEQVCNDKELMVEIIDLYLQESATQREQMQALLAAGNLPQLSRVAHTIKGSLSSLHAEAARAIAQDLELAAKREDAPTSDTALHALEGALAALEPELVRFRNEQL